MAVTVDVKRLDGTTDGTVDLPAEWFDGDVNVAAMHQVVTAQLAAARQGSVRTRTRGQARGGGRKPWRQKGTGRARHGSIRSPQWAGGGVAHGRTGDENFVKRVNRKVKRLALRSALTDRARSADVTVIRQLAFDRPRTKDAVAALDALELSRRKVLIVLGNVDIATWKSFRNLPSVHLLTVDQLNTYDVLRSDVVVFDEDALPLIGTGQRTPQRPAPDEETTDEPADDEPADDEPRADAATDEEVTA